MQNIKRISIAIFALYASIACADETNMLVRVKSGVNWPQGNTIVSYYTPVTVEWAYRVRENWNLGVSYTHASGSHEFSSLDVNSPGTIAGFNLSENQNVVFATADYLTQWGSCRISLGAKVGALFFQSSSSLTSGLVSAEVPASGSEKRFAIGPSINFDLPIKDRWLANIALEYISAINNNQLSYGSLYAGLGYEF